MRIGINVPSELMKKVKAIRPAVNVSQICREALDERVRVGERAIAQAEADGVDEQVVRLAESLGNSLIEPDWETYAIEDAREWVREVTVENWEWFIDYYDDCPENNRDDAWLMVDLWSGIHKGKGLHARIVDNQEWLQKQSRVISKLRSVQDPYDKARKSYARAWLGYILEARRRLEKHWKDAYERVKAEREQYRLSLPEPELPPQLIEEG